MKERLQHILFDAIEGHDEAAVRQALHDGADANMPLSGGGDWYPLHAAVEALFEGGGIGVVRVLLDHGAHVDANMSAGETPLLSASLHLARLNPAHLEVRQQAIAMLLDAGACPATQGLEGDTALAIAVEEGDEALVKRMLATGLCGDLDHWSGMGVLGGRTMLGHAVETLELGIMRALLGAGADPHATDDNYREAAFYLPAENSENRAARRQAVELLARRKG